MPASARPPRPPTRLPGPMASRRLLRPLGEARGWESPPRRLHSLRGAACTWAVPAAGPSARGRLAVPTGEVGIPRKQGSAWEFGFCQFLRDGRSGR